MPFLEEAEAGRRRQEGRGLSTEMGQAEDEHSQSRFSVSPMRTPTSRVPSLVATRHRANCMPRMWWGQMASCCC